MTSNTLTISSGPSKFDLMVSLFEGNLLPNERKTVQFNIQTGIRTAGAPETSLELLQEMQVAITSVSQQKGGGDGAWLIEGVEFDFNSRRRRVFRPVRGFYSSKKRKGWLEYKKQ